MIISPFVKKISIFILFIYLIKFLFIPKFVWFETKEFRVEFKDLNISYNYYGFGENRCDKVHFVLIVTVSKPDAFNLRRAIRKSWKKDIPSSITHKFFIGSVSDDSLKESLKIESWQYGDIIFTSITDNPLNLTFEINSLFQWQQNYCSNVSYLLRTDENTVLDVARFQYFLYEKFNPLSYVLNDMAIFGHLFHKKLVQRNPTEKWYVSYEKYNQTFYPDFVHGSSYLISPKAIKAILKETKNYKYLNVGDAFYTGILAEAAEISIIDSKEHFGFENPIIQGESECDKDGRPFLFSVFDKNGEIKAAQRGYDLALKQLKALKCPDK